MLDGYLLRGSILYVQLGRGQLCLRKEEGRSE
jgi:hypothetical protein